jgi:hypothetical protein
MFWSRVATRLPETLAAHGFPLKKHKWAKLCDFRVRVLVVLGKDAKGDTARHRPHGGTRMNRSAARLSSGASGVGISTALLSALLLVAIAHTAGAGGVVGTGTTGSCTDAELNWKLTGGGLVTFNCGTAAVTIDISPGAVGTGTKTIATDTTIDGGSQNLITISGGNSVGVFSVNTGVNFTVQNLTIANGYITGGGDDVGGGGIDNSGILTITNSTFSRNIAVSGPTDYDNSDGGGILNRAGGTVTITNCTFIENSANDGDADGGGISNRSGGTVTITNSTFTSNSAGGRDGGGIANRGTLSVTNSTFAWNSADYGGGGIANRGTLSVTNSTFANNRATTGGGGGISTIDGGTLMISNSTLSGNRANYGGGIANAPYPGGGIDNNGTIAATNNIFSGNSADDSMNDGNCYGRVTDAGHNIADDGSCGFSGTSLANTNPLLDSAGLANNGGSTQTIAIEPNSPAVNAGDESVCAAPPVNNLDQRGFVRPGTGATRCSIGAYEYNSGISCGSGACIFPQVCAAGQCATPTPTDTPTLPPTQTPTNTTGTFTPTPSRSAGAPTTTPTPTPPVAIACVGDCDGSGDVTVNELIIMVNIALGNAPLSACTAGDADHSGDITVNEIIAAVNNALNGCPGH